MKRCCFMFFAVRRGVRGLGVVFFLINLVLVFPIINGWIEVMSPPAPGLFHAPAPSDCLLSLYRRHQRALLALASAALLVALLVNVLLVYGSVRSRRRLLLPWLLWYGALFATVSLAVLAAVVLTVNKQLEIPLPGLLINVGLLPLYWYWFFVVAHLYANFDQHVSHDVERREKREENGAKPAAETTAPASKGPATAVQCTLGDAVWYWAALNATVMDTEQVRQEQEHRPAPDAEPQLRQVLGSLNSLSSLLYRIGASGRAEAAPPLPADTAAAAATGGSSGEPWSAAEPDTGGKEEDVLQMQPQRLRNGGHPTHSQSCSQPGAPTPDADSHSVHHTGDQP